MSKPADLFREGRQDELWKQCCGFIDLSLEDFMGVQKQLLLEQLELLKKCDLGHDIMHGLSPRSIDEFRATVPLTTYDDYAPYLLKRRPTGLPRKPVVWQYTSGKSGEYAFRWVPVTSRQLDQVEPLMYALILFSTCKGRGNVSLGGRRRALYGMAPPPYATGTLMRVLAEALDFLPDATEAENMDFEARIRKGFDMALGEGFDLCLALSSVAVAIGERVGQHSGRTDLGALLRRPRALARLAKGKLISKLARRPMMPKDLWPIKGLMTYGIDSSIYRDKIKKMWGRQPLEFHGCTEALIIAMQTWDYDAMTFVPNLNFFEFIPEAEGIRARLDPTYKPSTCLLDEVVPGKYELVITSFHGGPFVRYKLGHLVQITARRNERLNIDIPQMVFLTRVDDQIDIAGFTRLTEKVIWQAIENSGVPYADWTARKEVRDRPVLSLYLELTPGHTASSRKVGERIHAELKKLDGPYSELEAFTGLHPMEVTILPTGAFAAYKARQKASGAGLEHLNAPHIEVSDGVLRLLLSPQPVEAAPSRQRVEA